MRRSFLIAAAVAAAVVVACAALAVLRLASPLPGLTLTVHSPPSFALAPGAPPPIPLPPTGSFALGDDTGLLAARDATATRPVGSVAKTMTALLVLSTHPLGVGQPGPTLTLTPADVDLYRQAVAEQGSYIPVSSGEQLTERQLLLALLLPSANNIAETLARWSGGTRDAFLAALNARAQALGMTHTHFADPSGYDLATVSAAADLLRLGRAVTANPALLDLVSTQTAVLPGGLVLHNLDTLLGSEPGWTGIKTGWTPQAGGCLLFAAAQQLDASTPPVHLVGAILGQPPDAAADPAHPELGGAFRAAGSAVRAGFGGYVVASDATLAPPLAGDVSARWGGSAPLEAGYGAGDAVVVRRGATARLVLRVHAPSAPLAAGAVAGEVDAEVGGRDVLRWPVRVTRSLPGPSPWWRLLH
ncbi:MAG: D-alanyl-D-alanine carboxypeptidase [Candidatus Dormibacteraeota bacterium]|nr:D-alanyl-D-alanine carboxypeptidase [Candidatus Dormibacteraeota bacterium]MBV9525960.1 D-alanyl-D-alanine carboxypeptidase [Candidatus Dormibacteraeota bacterium]